SIVTSGVTETDQTDSFQEKVQSSTASSDTGDGDTGSSDDGGGSSTPTIETIKTLSADARGSYHTETSYGSGLKENINPKIIKDGSTYYYSADYSPDGKESISIKVPLDSYSPTSSYTGTTTLYHQDSGGDSSEYGVIRADSMMEVFFFMGGRYNELTHESEYSSIYGGIPSNYSNLPTEGVYGYTYDMSSHSRFIPVKSYGGYTNWKNKNILSIHRTNDANGNFYISMGKLADSDGAASISGKSYHMEYNLDPNNANNPYMGRGTLDGGIYGSEQQGMVLAEKLDDGNINLSGNFQDLNNKVSTSPTGSATLKGYTATYGKIESQGPFLGLGITTIGVDRDTGDVYGYANPDLGFFGGENDKFVFGGTGTAGSKSGYINDSYFAAMSNGNSASVTCTSDCEGTFTQKDSEGFMVATGADEYFSWGYWAQETNEGLSVSPNSMWIAGEVETTQSYIDNLVASSTTYTYNGDVIGSYQSNSASGMLDPSSNFDMIIDFGAGSITGDMNLNDGTSTRTFNFADGSVNGNVISGILTSTDVYEGAFRGGIYGAEANAVGGGYNVIEGDPNGTFWQSAGIFKGKR
ncbi:MAG: transferrin-binding protein-like solute binding protein, partial [Campylobacterales bacterium]